MINIRFYCLNYDISFSVMEFLKQYIRIISYALMGLAFSFASFYLIINAYHYFEIRKNFSVNFDNQSLVLAIKENMAKVSANIDNFDANKYHGNMEPSKMLVIASNLNTCVNSFNNDTFKGMSGKEEVSIVDVYKLRESYEDSVLSDCIAGSLYWTTSIDDSNFNSKYLLDNKNLIQLYVTSLLNETSYLKSDLINNSSYYFNTSIASTSIKNNTKDGFYEVLNAYNKASNFVLFISEWFNNEVEGNYG